MKALERRDNWYVPEGLGSLVGGGHGGLAIETLVAGAVQRRPVRGSACRWSSVLGHCGDVWFELGGQWVMKNFEGF